MREERILGSARGTGMHQQASPAQVRWGSRCLEGGWPWWMEVGWWVATTNCGSPVALLVGGMG